MRTKLGSKIILITLAGISSLSTISCKKDPELPEIDPIFQEKKRPPYNEVVLSKIKSRENDPDYQEVNPNFANEYQDAQREYERKGLNQSAVNQVNTSTQPSTSDIIQTQSSPKQYEPLTVQKIRDDSSALTNPSPTVQPPKQIEITPSQVQPTGNSTGEVFEIQAGSFKSEEGAKQVVQKMQKAGFNVRIDKINEANSVRITGSQPFTTRSEASKFLQQVIDKTQHYDIMIVRK